LRFTAAASPADRVLLPPPVLTALYRQGITRVYADGPRTLPPLPVCPFVPADDPGALPWALGAGFLA
jgi:hypothetical protein